MQVIKEALVRYFSQILVVITLVLVGWLGISLYNSKKQNKDLYTNLIGTQEKYQQITKYTAQLETDYKNQKDLTAKADAQWKEVVRQKDEKISLLSDATYLISKQVTSQNGPDYSYYTPKRTQNLIVDEVRIAGSDSPPIGFVVIKSDGKTYKGNYKFQIQVENLQTRDPNTGKIKVYSKAFLVAQENGLAEKRKPELKKWKDVQYPLDIVGGVTEVDPTVPDLTQTKHFLLWAPRLVGGADFGVDPKGGFDRFSLGMSFMGYGVSQRDLDWRFLQLGIDTNTSIGGSGLSFVPISYRPFPNFLTNTYFGPGIGLDENGTSYLLNLSIGF